MQSFILHTPNGKQETISASEALGKIATFMQAHWGHGEKLAEQEASYALREVTTDLPFDAVIRGTDDLPFRITAA